MDRYTKIILTVIAIALISIAVKDVNLFPIAEAQQGWEIDNEIAMMDGSMQALPEASGFGYVCRTFWMPNHYNQDLTDWGLHGYLRVTFYTEPQCEGLHLGSGYFYSDGTIHENSLPRYWLSENQMMYFADAAARAADTGQRVSYHRCSNSKPKCLRTIQFRGAPADGVG